MFAHLIAYEPNGRGATSQESVEYNSTYVIELTINNRRFQFDSEGNLMNQSAILTCNVSQPKVSCAYLPTENVCYPVINSKSED